MTLREANYKVEKLSNEIELLLREKESLELMVEPQAVDTTKITVDGGKRVDKLPIYVYEKELKDIDNKLQIKQEQRKNYMDWIDRELKILKKYDQVEQLIIYYKEIDTHKYTWLQISMMVGIHYSVPQCKRIYRRYREKRYTDD